jgi:four helix bundle protein
MKTFKKIEEIEVWKLARELAQRIWVISQQGAFSRDFGLKNQINKACGSVMDNIAEGHGRGGNKEFINFLGYAKGSAEEIKSQLYRALDRSHLKDQEFRELFFRVEKIGTKLNNLIDYLRNSDIRGPKFK